MVAGGGSAGAEAGGVAAFDAAALPWYGTRNTAASARKTLGSADSGAASVPGIVPTLLAVRRAVQQLSPEMWG